MCTPGPRASGWWADELSASAALELGEGLSFLRVFSGKALGSACLGYPQPTFPKSSDQMHLAGSAAKSPGPHFAKAFPWPTICVITMYLSLNDSILTYLPVRILVILPVLQMRNLWLRERQGDLI